MKTLKITEDAHEGLDWLKDLLNVPSYSLCILESVRFFKNNNVSPRDSINNTFTNYLIETKSEIKTDIVDLKKFIKEGKSVV